MNVARAARLFPMLTVWILSCVLSTARSDVRAQDESDAGGLVGRWIAVDVSGRVATLTFLPGRVFDVEFQGDDTVEVSGHYEAVGNRLTLTDEGGIAACLAPDYGPGIYRFTIRNNELTLDALKDVCAGRAMILQRSGASKHSWNRKKA
jgi:hypothetical protein